MGSFSIWHILILGGAALLLFGGRGKISDFMGDFGKGIRSFKKGLVEEDAGSAPRTGSDESRTSIAKQSPPTTLAAAVPAQAVGES